MSQRTRVNIARLLSAHSVALSMFGVIQESLFSAPTSQ